MPKCYESMDVTGYVTKDVVDLTGLKEGTIIIGRTSISSRSNWSSISCYFRVVCVFETTI
ncbi:hypothetical protein TTE0198 [Caldanaerobacter subterraneus subsp. tengcongensis MB4]|uniref:Uncharacterized protein n=2 Tax=Caldanaerobacter subterraneus TaxID=911092 RepID=Q8RD49_CALS4|nr:hypothetical protein TTE0198 [Caldanaerobacter subterraneus subsp. tengcongensis MB4]